MNTYLLNITQIKNNIDLKEKAGIICIRRASWCTEEVILETKDGYDQRAIDLLAFLFNTGLKVERQIMFNCSYVPAEIAKLPALNIENFDIDLFDKYYLRILQLCKSKSLKHYRRGCKMKNLLEIYNKSKLLILNFKDESYLNLWRVLEAQEELDGTNPLIFAHKIIKILPKKFISDAYAQILNVELYKNEHVPLAKKMFEKIKKSSLEKSGDRSLSKKYYELDKFKVFFMSLYALYQYRNKFVHCGFPFPHKISGVYDESASGLNYFGASFGEHDIINTEVAPIETIDKNRALKKYHRKKYIPFNKFYLLLPKRYFLNQIAREVLYYRFKNL